MSARDTLTKLRILVDYIRVAYSDWQTLVWRNDLDAPYCCDGRECGCGAQTIRQIHTPMEEPK